MFLFRLERTAGLVSHRGSRKEENRHARRTVLSWSELTERFAHIHLRHDPSNPSLARTSRPRFLEMEMRLPPAAKPAANNDPASGRLIRGSYFGRLPAARRAEMIEEVLAQPIEEILRRGELLLSESSLAGISI